MHVHGIEIKIGRIVAAVAGAALLAIGTARAFNPQPEPPAFGMVGLAWTQNATLNVVLTQPPDPGQPPDPAHPGCEVVLSFLGADGQPFHDSGGAAITKRVRLRGATAESLVLRASQAIPSRQLRAAFRPVVTQPPDPTEPSDCTGLVATLELVNSLGITDLLYAAPALLPAGEPR